MAMLRAPATGAAPTMSDRKLSAPSSPCRTLFSPPSS